VTASGSVPRVLVKDAARVSRRHFVGLQVSNLVMKEGQHTIRLERKDMDANVDLALETDQR
jgi:hypothetical protein